METCHCEPESKIKKFAPLVIMFALVITYTIYGQFALGTFATHVAMMDFMGAYFLLFGLLKAINVRSFAKSYAQYDILARENKAWGYIYPFVELALGATYIAGIDSTYINIFVFLLMSLKAYSVWIKLAQNEDLQCACLGGFFKIPITWFTVFEDILMAAMAIAMLLTF